MLAVTLALARLVFEPSSPTPKVHEEAVLLIQRVNANLGCGPGDAGPVDAPDASDAGLDAGVDAGAPNDAGCEPIVGDAVTMVIRPRFETSAIGARFALLFVTPSRPIVEVVDDPFPALAALTAARTEVHVTEVQDPSLGERCQTGGGCGFGAPTSSPSFDLPDLGDAGLGDGAPVVEPVGPYEIVRVQPADPPELEALLSSLDYRVQAADLAALAPYIAAGYTVVAVRVAVEEASTSSLAPISMTWAGNELRLPLALGDQGPGVLTAYIGASGRYELPGADVAFAKFVAGGDVAFVTRNELFAFDSESPATDPVAAAIPGSPEFELVHVVEQTRRVPVTNCEVEVGCCDSGNPRGDFGVLAIGVVLVLRRRRLRVTASR